MMVDAGRLRALLDRIAVEVSALRRLGAMSNEELRADPERLPGLKYRLQIAIEVCIDVAEHTIAADDYRSPDTFADAFTVLGEEDLISPEHQAALEDAARLRNLLVHGYATVDDDRVVAILRSRLDDLDRFRRVMAAHAEQPSRPGDG